jgi:putative addiction module killer protein
MLVCKTTGVYKKWFGNLDKNIRFIIIAYIGRLTKGNYSKCKSVGDGVYELKINYQKGYRVYFANIDGEIILLLIGGDKKTQDKDIKKAKELKKELL